MAACECSSISSLCGQPFSIASRKRCSEPTPGLPPHENTSLVDAAHADHLIVDEIRRHADQRQVFASLADDLVAGGMRNEMGEPLQSHGIAIANGGFDGFGERGNTRHVYTVSRLRTRIYGWPPAGSNGGCIKLEPQRIATDAEQAADFHDKCRTRGRSPVWAARPMASAGLSAFSAAACADRSLPGAFCPAAPIGRSSAATGQPTSRLATPSRPTPEL